MKKIIYSRHSLFLILLINLSFSLSAQWTLVGESFISDQATQNRMISTLNGDGSIVAISEVFFIQEGFSNEVIKVYEFENGSWQLINDPITIPRINGIRRASIDGLELSDDGNILAVATPLTGIENEFRLVPKVGVVYFFHNINGEWIFKGFLRGEGENSVFGTSMDISSDGTRIIIGAPTSSGIVDGIYEVYEFENDNWARLGQRIKDEDFSQDGVYVSISADGKRIANGSPFDNNTNGLIAGAVSIREYDKETDSWELITDPIFGGEELEAFGQSVDLDESGNRLVVGSVGTFSEQNQVEGSFKLLEFQNGEWIQIGDDVFTEFSLGLDFSLELSSDGTRVLVSNVGSSVDNFMAASLLFELDPVTESWVQINETLASDENFSTSSINSMSRDGAVIALSGSIPSPDGALETFKRTDVYAANSMVLSVPSSFEPATEVEVYPNPVQNKSSLFIKMDHTSAYKRGTVKIFDIIGNLKIEKVVDDLNSLELPLNLPSGLYVLTISTDTKEYHSKIVVE